MRKRVKVTNKGKCSVSMYCQKCSVHYTLTGFSSEQHDRMEPLQRHTGELPAFRKEDRIVREIYNLGLHRKTGRDVTDNRAEHPFRW